MLSGAGMSASVPAGTNASVNAMRSRTNRSSSMSVVTNLGPALRSSALSHTARTIVPVPPPAHSVTPSSSELPSGRVIFVSETVTPTSSRNRPSTARFPLPSEENGWMWMMLSPWEWIPTLSPSLSAYGALNVVQL